MEINIALCTSDSFLDNCIKKKKNKLEDDCLVEYIELGQRRQKIQLMMSPD
jgi:hypothetical protein